MAYTPQTPREQIRVQRHKVFRKGAAAGVDLESERNKDGSNPRTLALATKKLINDPVPRKNSEQLRREVPDGALNGANTTFTLTVPVSGLNIEVAWMDLSAMALIPLVRSTSTPPAAGEFYFDPSTPTQFVVGTAPDSDDGLLAFFLVAPTA
jgi:hypothetical protein